MNQNMYSYPKPIQTIPTGEHSSNNAISLATSTKVEVWLPNSNPITNSRGSLEKLPSANQNRARYENRLTVETNQKQTRPHSADDNAAGNSSKQAANMDVVRKLPVVGEQKKSSKSAQSKLLETGTGKGGAEIGKNKTRTHSADARIVQARDDGHDRSQAGNEGSAAERLANFWRSESVIAGKQTKNGGLEKSNISGSAPATKPEPVDCRDPMKSVTTSFPSWKQKRQIRNGMPRPMTTRFPVKLEKRATPVNCESGDTLSGVTSPRCNETQTSQDLTSNMLTLENLSQGLTCYLPHIRRSRQSFCKSTLLLPDRMRITPISSGRSADQTGSTQSENSEGPNAEPCVPPSPGSAEDSKSNRTTLVVTRFKPDLNMVQGVNYPLIMKNDKRQPAGVSAGRAATDVAPKCDFNGKLADAANGSLEIKSTMKTKDLQEVPRKISSGNVKSGRNVESSNAEDNQGPHQQQSSNSNCAEMPTPDFSVRFLVAVKNSVSGDQTRNHQLGKTPAETPIIPTYQGEVRNLINYTFKPISSFDFRSQKLNFLVDSACQENSDSSSSVISEEMPKAISHFPDGNRVEFWDLPKPDVLPVKSILKKKTMRRGFEPAENFTLCDSHRIRSQMIRPKHVWCDSTTDLANTWDQEMTSLCKFLGPAQSNVNQKRVTFEL